jgi:hypothetical protein
MACSGGGQGTKQFVGREQIRQPGGQGQEVVTAETEALREVSRLDVLPKGKCCQAEVGQMEEAGRVGSVDGRPNRGDQTDLLEAGHRAVETRRTAQAEELLQDGDIQERQTRQQPEDAGARLPPLQPPHRLGGIAPAQR